MTVHPDNRLLDAAPVPVRCRRCEATVQVRKSSWAQTSVQWDAAALAACVQRREAVRRSGRGSLLICSELRASLEDAAGRGDLPILGENPVD